MEALEPSHGGVAGKQEGDSMRSDAVVHRISRSDPALSEKVPVLYHVSALMRTRSHISFQLKEGKRGYETRLTCCKQTKPQHKAGVTRSAVLFSYSFLLTE